MHTVNPGLNGVNPIPAHSLRTEQFPMHSSNVSFTDTGSTWCASSFNVENSSAAPWFVGTTPSKTTINSASKTRSSDDNVVVVAGDVLSVVPVVVVGGPDVVRGVAP